MTIFCDLDGTLIDSSRRHVVLLESILLKPEYGSIISTEDYLSTKADGVNTKDYLISKGISSEMAGRIAGEWSQHIEDDDYLKLDTVYPDTFEFLHLQHLAHRNIIYITARRNRDGLMESLTRLGLDRHACDVIVVSTVSATAKKEQALRSLAQDDDVFVGDTEVDMKCAASVGIRGIALNRGFRSIRYWQRKGVISYEDLMEVARAI